MLSSSGKMMKTWSVFLLSLVLAFNLVSCGDTNDPEAPPLPPILDFDNDGIPDKDDFDGDNDGLIDVDEQRVNLNPYDADDALEDRDSDGFSNAEEVYLNTNLDDAEDYPLALSWNSFQGNAGRTGFNLQQVESGRISLIWTREGHYMSPVVANQSGVFFAESYDTVNLKTSVHVFRLNPMSGNTQWESVVSAAFLDSELEGSVFSSIIGNYSHSLALGDTNIILKLMGGLIDSSYTRYSDAVFSTIISIVSGEKIGITSQYILGGATTAPTYSDGRFYLTGGIVSEDGAKTNIINLYPNSKWTPSVNDGALFECTPPPSLEKSRLTRQDITAAVDSTQIYSVANIPGWDGCAEGTAPVIGHYNNLITVGNGKLSSIELENKSLMWQLPVSDVQPSIGFGRVYAALENKLLAVNEFSGDIIWQYEDMGDVNSNIVVTRNMLFFSTPTQTIGLDSETGEYLWSVPHSGHLTVSYGMLYIQQTDLLLAYRID